MSSNAQGVASISAGREDPDAVRERLGRDLPYLRRYARALSGSQESGDAFVRATLQAALTNPETLAHIGRGRVQLYGAFTRIWNSAHVPVGEAPLDAVGALEQVVQHRLADVSPVGRQALLLTHLEDFTPAQAGEILDLSEEKVTTLVEQTIREIEGETATDVLIIEDESLISSHIESIVTDMGHRVVALAATATQARERYAEHRPGLVLADIQLADGSSGLDAVQDILELGPVPVIFITAFPEKLLTGERPEPSFLITKPFRDETVRATISQALFFGADFKA